MSIGRQFWVIVHRWAGLTIAVFLAIAGLTGALLAFMDELDPLLAPQVHFVEPPALEAKRLDPIELRERVQASHPGAVINYVPPGRASRSISTKCTTRS